MFTLWRDTPPSNKERLTSHRLFHTQDTWWIRVKLPHVHTNTLFYSYLLLKICVWPWSHWIQDVPTLSSDQKFPAKYNSHLFCIRSKRKQRPLPRGVRGPLRLRAGHRGATVGKHHRSLPFEVFLFPRRVSCCCFCRACCAAIILAQELFRVDWCKFFPSVSFNRRQQFGFQH